MTYDFQSFSQKKYQTSKEIWHSEDRIDFLINELPKLSKNQTKPVIGRYLKAAKLLSDREIEIILAHQKQCNSKFGEIAINQGFTDPVVIEFFLEIIAV